ncbi:MAG: flagellin [Planctomycetota bacterium]|nr:flagellin [Planctomycetota bacterium]
MSTIPSNLTRVPNLLRSSIASGTIGRTNLDLLRVQQQIVSGVEIGRPSDNIVRSALISVLDERLERSAQLERNFSHADAALGVLDSIFAEAHTLGLNAKSIASEQMSASSNAEERAAQANILDQMIQSLYNTANRQSVAGYALAGTRTGSPPVVELYGGYRFVGGIGGLTTDLDLPVGVPVTLGGGNAITGLAARTRGDVDLDPNLTLDTRLADLGGARGLGVGTGTLRFSFNAGASVDVDLAGADTVGDVVTRLTSAIRQAETDQGVTILGPGGVSVTGEGVSIDVASGGSLQFSDIGTATVAGDLGLTGDPAFAFTPTSAAGLDLGPRLTWRTPVSALAGVTGGLGRISLSNASRTVTVDLSNAQTLGDVRNAIEGAGLGVRVLIGLDGATLDVLSETAAGSAGAMSITDVVGQNSTATRLGIRTMTGATRIADFNFGRGVTIVDGRIDPLTDTPTRTVNADMRVVLGDASGTPIEIDLRPQDMATVQTVLDRMNAEIQSELAAAGLPSTALVAELAEGSNSIVLRQDAGFTQPLRVEARNNSAAAEQLGLLHGTYDATSAGLVGEDRAKVRVDGLFSDLIDLRDALRANDTRGMALAGLSLDASIDSLTDTRGLVGGYAQRVEAALVRETDRATSDEAVRSELRDTDFAKAASRLSLLETQLQAALRVAGSTQQLSILNYLA